MASMQTLDKYEPQGGCDASPNTQSFVASALV